jgi:hypothetical protein
MASDGADVLHQSFSLMHSRSNRKIFLLSLYLQDHGEDGQDKKISDKKDLDYFARSRRVIVDSLRPVHQLQGHERVLSCFCDWGANLHYISTMVFFYIRLGGTDL